MSQAAARGVRWSRVLWELGQHGPKRLQKVPGGSNRYQVVPSAVGVLLAWVRGNKRSQVDPRGTRWFRTL